MQEGDYVSATALLSRGADYAAANRSEFTKILFLLSKGMVSTVSRVCSCAFVKVSLFNCSLYSASLQNAFLSYKLV